MKVASGMIAATALALLPMKSRAEGVDRLELGATPGEAALVQLLWLRSPDLVSARAKVEAARADVDRAHQLPNPELDLSLNNFPLGATNPPGLSPLGEVANYAASISELVELGKRGPRQRSAGSALTAAALDAYELLRQRYLDVMERIAEVAAAEVTVLALSDLTTDAARLTELTHQRVGAGDAAGLDQDRAVLEEEKLQSNLAEARQRLSTALLSCAQVAGVPCLPFGGREPALAFLDTQALHAQRAPLEQRADLASLAAQEAGAQAALDLAHARAIPDPTLRVGYTQDQFIVSGNQPRAVFVGVSIPLPLFDHGQADARQATATAEAAGRQRALLRAQAERDVSRLTTQRDEAVARRQRMRARTLPLARGVVERLEGAVLGKGAPLQDLLLARRTLGELLVDAAELDLLTFHLSATLARTAAGGPPAPAELRDALPSLTTQVSP